MEIIVIGTDEYFWAVRAFADLFNHYWEKVKVTHYGNVPCENLPDNFESKQVPAYKEGIWPWRHWFGNGLISILESIVSEHVVIFFPDQFIKSHVDRKAIRYLLRYMEVYPRVVRGNLTTNTCLDSYGQTIKERNGYKIVQVSPDHRHCGLFGGLTFSPAIYNRLSLLEIIEPHWDLWECENVGTERIRQSWSKWRSVGIVPGAIDRVHGLYHAQEKMVFVSDLSEKDQDIVKGYIPSDWTVK